MDAFERVTRGAEEVVTAEELRALLQRPDRRAYIGFEPSGTAHIGYMLIADKVRDLQDAGFHVTIFLADWHAYINDKFGGDLEAIRACAEYMQDMFAALGVQPSVHYKYAQACVEDPKYWETVIRVAKASSLSRVKRAMSIMGRKEEDAELDYSKTIYPVMQVADIFYNEWHLAYGGMDQRHAHMLARDAAEKLGWWKPVALHTPLLPSLAGPGAGRMNPVEMGLTPDELETLRLIERRLERRSSEEGNATASYDETYLGMNELRVLKGHSDWTKTPEGKAQFNRDILKRAADLPENPPDKRATIRRILERSIEDGRDPIIEDAPFLSKKERTALAKARLTYASNNQEYVELSRVRSFLAGETEVKMSKSKAGSGVFLHDTTAEVEQKLQGAFCPPKQVEGNPVLAIARLILFAREGYAMRVERPAKFGGPLELRSFAELEQAYAQGLHPLDLKKAVARGLDERLAAVREHFAKHPRSLERMRALTAKRP